ncbi:uncharacterized protein LOC132624497 [Lycium barbarum]|uniref:uncharacterized protein LOC132624497 n=1 Tax=Lycium barbarum TaxID=112863 RepID=UPI00293F0940|nr:uncharacterized protein LOC132624497 [Lycium barbarum]
MYPYGKTRTPWIVRLQCCFLFLIFAECKVPQEEVDVLQQIAKTMGATYLSFDADTCRIEEVKVTVKPLGWSENIVECDRENGSEVYHITKIALKGLNLPGELPPELVKLPYIREIDFAYNYLSGSIPVEWATTQLTNISVLVNRLSGEIPKELGNISSLLYLNLEGNQFSGNVPSELGKLIYLQTLFLSSNQLVGEVPTSFSELVNLTDFRINDNNFSGQIPDFIQNWKQLTKLEMHATGLEGPIPSNISLLNKLTDLRISDIGGPAQTFPSLSDIAGIQTLVLRNCGLSGELPVYIWAMKDLQTLDVTFNKLVGEIPNNISSRSTLKFVFLTGNMLSGDIPDSILKNGINVDLSYNNFTWQGPDQNACQQNMNLYLNLYKSSAAVSPLKRILPCTKDFTCPRYGCSLHVNSGGNDFAVKESDREVDYEGDAGVDGGSARYFSTYTNYWGLSSTGDFMDDNNDQNARFIESTPSKGLSELYNNARMSPLSLTYIRYCLANGSYNVSLHFAEIAFTNDSTYTSLGRRVFDIYIQEKLVWKDFNIVNEADGVQRPVVRHFNTSVTDNTLEIRFYWAGKGTTRIPSRGHYGPLISAISLKPTFGSCSEEDKKSVTAYIIVGVVAACIFLLVMSALWWKGYLQCKKKQRTDLEGMEPQTVSYTLKQIKAATNNFDASNKIGEGGFGAVFKGRLSDGTSVAVKQLSHSSRQGNREFLNEIAMISCFQHPNLVNLLGCCIEGTELLLVYEYLENNSLARALFNSEKSQLILDWPTRVKICVGIAKGLAYLHEESSLRIVHRDIKATNVLLDRDLNPKISDFGLARLTGDDNTHISTRVAGTIGYMAPEYALWGYLTYKADVYSFGIVLLEIVSGKNNNNYAPSDNFICLLDWACHLLQNGKIEELIDDKLGSHFSKAEAERTIKVALLCTSATPSLRPIMSEAVGMLEGKRDVPDDIPEASMYTDDLRFKALKDFQRERQINQSASSSQAQLASVQTASDLCEYNPESRSDWKKMLPLKTALLTWILVVNYFMLLNLGESRVAQEEVNILEQIAVTMGATHWKFNGESCQIGAVRVTTDQPSWSETDVKCNCSIGNDTACHIVAITLKGISLSGVLPPELVKLPYIQKVDFAYNYLSGSIPIEWASTQLNSISVLVNRLSGEIPKEIGNITSLTYINLEGNQFSGVIPHELGKLINLKALILSSNQLEGELPISLSGLVNLADFRISDNNLSGPIPDFIEKWKQLTKLELHATGLEGPIPSNISLLNMLTDLRISDIKGPMQEFPPLINMTDLVILVLRNCNLSGVIPGYIWQLKTIQTLDVSFNKLAGTIPDDISARSMLKFVFLSGNMLIGNIPASILKNGINVDLSYNNFTWQGPDQPACRQNTNYYINLYKSSAAAGNLKNVLPCAEHLTCPRYGCSLHVNCGGNDVSVKENNRLIDYDGDAQVEGGSARYFRSDKYWGFSSTGDFMDDANDQNTRFIETIPSTNLPELYNRARVSPLSLTYFRYCLENGSYNVKLHFAEIIFKNDSTYNSIGRRVFDIYIQEKLVWKDFNIEEEARGVQRPVIRYFNATVADSILEIRFYWAGKGTARIPLRGHYGSLISAISVDPNFKLCSNKDRKTTIIYIIVGVLAACITFFVLSILWWKGCLCRKRKRRDLNGVELQMVCFTLKQIKAATKNFDASNKIGEGGFGPVYKGQLPDRTLVAVKKLSSQSKQGNREFLNEISTISCLQHPNLVKLHGCCIEADQLLLVYEYLDNNSLASVLFGSEDSRLRLDWPTRFRICVGIARGLAFLHEESSLKIVHRDIKATNVLLDGQLNPKISDFGLARLTGEEKTHISTRVAGTIGYMAPEYALWGYLTDKADVYSFGVVLLETVSGKNNNNYMPSDNSICLLDWACHLQQSGSIDELIDQRLGSDINKQEVEKIVKVALLCTSATPSLRPIMSEAVAMLEGRIAIPEEIPEASIYSNDLRFKAMKDFHQERKNQKLIGSQTQNTMTIRTDTGSSSASTTNLFDTVQFQNQTDT